MKRYYLWCLKEMVGPWINAAVDFLQGWLERRRVAQCETFPRPTDYNNTVHGFYSWKDIKRFHQLLLNERKANG